jgi:carbon storage regulator
MLVLSRRKGEQVVLPGYGVAITVLDVKGKTIRLGIAAPRDVGILRGELVPQATPVANASAAESTTD